MSTSRRLGAGLLARGVIVGVLLAGCTDVAAQSQPPSATDGTTDSPTYPVAASPTDTKLDSRADPVPVSLAGRLPGVPASPVVPKNDRVSARPSPSNTSPDASPHPGRLVLIGDSIVDQLCAEFPTATCIAFPGAWVADVNGVNLADSFVTQAQLEQDDTVVLSSIGGWHSPGVDDGEILHRLQALYQRVSSTVRRLIVLVPPSTNFPLCTDPATPEAMALLGERHDELCHTQQLITDLERSWPVTKVQIIGPYLSDEEHETPQARQELAREIRFVLASDPYVVTG